MLSLDGEIKTLFETDRLGIFTLSPNGGAILAADAQSESPGSPVKSVDILALDGSVMHTFGAFTNHTASIYPSVWSPDGSMVAFANLRRVYVAQSNGAGLPDGVAGIPPEAREVYAASDEFVQPYILSLGFSKDNKYLLMDAYDGVPHFAVVTLDTGQSSPLEITGMTDIEQAGSFSWRQ